MIVPFVDFAAEYRANKTQYDDAIQTCLGNGDLVLRKDGEEFEEKFAKLHGAKYGVGLNSGTDALKLALKALEIREGDEVITVSYTFKATLEAIKHCGANPILVDVGRDRLMDVDKVASAISHRTKAIIPVHIEGNVVNIDALKKFKLPIVEDSAQAVTTKLKGDAACFSFYPAKILGCWGDGGMLITNSAKIAEEVKLYRHHWQTGKDERYGYNSRLDNIHAATLNVKIRNIRKTLEARKLIAERYDRAFANLDMELPMERDIYQDYVILVKKPKEMQEFLTYQGVETLIAPPAPHIALRIGYSLPRTEEIFRDSIRLPCNETLTTGQVDHVINKVREYYD